MPIADRDGPVRIRRADGAEMQVPYRRATSLVSRGLAEFATKRKTRRSKPEDKTTLPDAADKAEDVATAEDMPPATEE